MTKFVFKNSNADFTKRSKESLMRNILISSLVSLAIAAANNWIWGLIIGSILFIVQSYKSNKWDNIFIDQITIDENLTSINYSEKNKQIKLEGKSGDFSFIKKTALNRTRTIYLSVYYEGNLKLKQFEIGEWSEYRMDEVIHSFKKTVNNLHD